MHSARPLAGFFLGRQVYLRSRSLQEAALHNRLKGKCGDRIFYLEHESVITCGRSVKLAELSEKFCESAELSLIETNRGGKLTAHLPGQLVIYPVVKLGDYGLGAKSFMLLVLQSISSALLAYGLNTEVKLNPLGVWAGEKKLAQGGIALNRGISNHGFSLNVNCDLQVFKLFLPCGLPSSSVTSLAELAPETSWSLFQLSVEIQRLLVKSLGSGAKFN